MNRRYGNLCWVSIYRHVTIIKNQPDNPLKVLILPNHHLVRNGRG